MTNVPLSGKPEGVEVQVDVSTERWSDYKLSDGTIVKAKVTIVKAVRLNQFDPNNNRPVYAIEATMTTVVSDVPPELMKQS